MRVREQLAPVVQAPDSAPSESGPTKAGQRQRHGKGHRGLWWVPLTVAALPLVLAGCAPAETVQPAASANAPACADVMLSLPHELDGLNKRKTTSQATAAWGNPASIILRCGTKDRGPTSDPCTTVDGVDWVSTEEEGDRWRLTAYGRTPGIEVSMDTTKVSSSNVAEGLTDAVKLSPAKKHCTEAPKQ